MTMTATDLCILAGDLLPLVAARATAAHTEPEREEWVILYDKLDRIHERFEEWICEQQLKAGLEPGP
jgi:hypothetical protein